MNTNDPVDRLSELVTRARRAAGDDIDTDSRIEALEEALDAALAVLDSMGVDLTPEPTYKIQRHFFSDDFDTVVIATGLTLEQAQAHCNDPETSSQTAKSRKMVALTAKVGSWFDSYTDESR